MKKVLGCRVETHYEKSLSYKYKEHI